MYNINADIYIINPLRNHKTNKKFTIVKTLIANNCSVFALSKGNISNVH